MEWLKVVEPLFMNKLVQFFVWMALLHILAQVFLDRKLAFWVASLSTTYLWIEAYEAITPLKAWSLILSILFVYLILKSLFHINLFLYLKGKKRCPACFSEVHWKARICPYCHHSLKKVEIAQEY